MIFFIYKVIREKFQFLYKDQTCRIEPEFDIRGILDFKNTYQFTRTVLILKFWISTSHLTEFFRFSQKHFMKISVP